MKNILFINAFDYLGVSFIDHSIKDNPQATFYLVGKHVDNSILTMFKGNKQVVLLTSEAFFQQTLENEKFDTIIYNTLTETGTLQEINKLLHKAANDHAEFLLLEDINIPANEGEQALTDTLIDTAIQAIKNGVHGKILYFGELFGPGMSFASQTPLASLLRQCMKAGSLQPSEAESFRYYLYIDDALQGIFTAIQYASSGSYTIAEPYDISLSALITRLAEMTGKNYAFPERTTNEDHIKTLPYVLPGWRPETSLEKGFEQTLAWMKETIPHASAMPIYIMHSQAQKPIRNYTPSVFREVPENLTEVDSFYETRKERKHIKTITDIRGYEAKPAESMPVSEKKMPFKKPTLPIHFNEIINQLKSKIVFLILGLIILIGIAIIFIPIALSAKDYIFIKQALNQTTYTPKQVLSADADMQNQLAQLTLLINLFKQQNRYSNMIHTLHVITDIATSAQDMQDIQSTMQSSANAIKKQNAQTQTVISTVNISNKIDDTKATIIATQDNMQTYLAAFPADVSHIQTTLTNDLTSLQTYSQQQNTINTFLKSDKRYLFVVYTGNTNTIYQTIHGVFDLQFSNGLFKGITTVAIPSNLKNEPLPALSANIKNTYTDTYDGIIYIDQTTLSALATGQNLQQIVYNLIQQLLEQKTSTIQAITQSKNVSIVVGDSIVTLH